jgi:glycosyltransferase involved in cell wall biosynthesis
MRQAGVTKPIYIIPEAIDTDTGTTEPYIVAEHPWSFYSIFEWTERKNPGALLHAYWQEFTEKDNVRLVIKTYIDNFQKDKRDELMQNIKREKKIANLSYYPPLYIYRNLMDRRQMYRFHKTFDCFVSAHRGEGWGVPQMEAMLMGKPIISTNCGGIHEHIENGKHGLMIPWQWTQVENTRNKQWYLPDQNWATIDITLLRKAMHTPTNTRKQ